MILSALDPQPVFGFERVSVDEPRRAGVIEDGDPELLELGPHGRNMADLRDDVAHPVQETAVVQGGLACVDAKGVELPGLSA